MATKVRTFSLLQYLDAALTLAEYGRDANGIVIALVPNTPGFYAQGDTFEEARTNLQDVVEGNILLALQLGLPIPLLPGVSIEERDAY